MNSINIIEIKARCAEPQRIRDALLARQADFRGVDHQVDTYFNTTRGRLKLREGRIENALIFYQREDQAGPKQSQVLLQPVPPQASLKDMLSQALGVLVVVEKQREIYFLANVKFHIDTVPGLGSFMEVEAIDVDGSLGKEKLLAQCQEFLALFAIQPQDLVTGSYSDLLLAQEQRLA